MTGEEFYRKRMEETNWPKDIVLPTNTNGKVRTSEVKVLREVPLEECGVFGKILAKRRNK